MATVKNVKVWIKNGEKRVYVDMSDGRTGCKYITGNKWQTAGTKDGSMIQAEWKAAWDMANFNGKWINVWDGVPEGFKNADTGRADRFASDGI